MSFITQKTNIPVAIMIKNLRIRLRSVQTYIYSFGFPLMFTFLFYILIGMGEIPGTEYQVFDLAISGMLIYTASFGTINAAISLTGERDKGTLTRIDTTPARRSQVFIGTLLSESTFLVFQLILMMFIGYGVLGLTWYNNDPVLLVYGFLIAFVYGLSTLGTGIIISAYAKSADSAVGLAMMVVIPVLFLSGAFIPFESSIVYLFPPFWANHMYQQVVVLGDNILGGFIRYNSYNLITAEFTSIPLWFAFVIITVFLAITMYVGIKLFQRKTIN